MKAFSKLPELKGYQNEIAGIICAFSDSILRHHSSVIDIKEIENPDFFGCSWPMMRIEIEVITTGDCE